MLRILLLAGVIGRLLAWLLLLGIIRLLLLLVVRVLLLAWLLLRVVLLLLVGVIGRLLLGSGSLVPLLLRLLPVLRERRTIKGKVAHRQQVQGSLLTEELTAGTPGQLHQIKRKLV